MDQRPGPGAGGAAGGGKIGSNPTESDRSNLSDSFGVRSAFHAGRIEDERKTQPAELPPIDSTAQLRSYLESELGYCTCAFNDAVPLLRDVLVLARNRTEAAGNFDEFRIASHILDGRLGVESSSGLASWFVYFLERAGLVEHNFNIQDLWITPKGRQLIAALERFPDPSTFEETDTAAEP